MFGDVNEYFGYFGEWWIFVVGYWFGLDVVYGLRLCDCCSIGVFVCFYCFKVYDVFFEVG